MLNQRQSFILKDLETAKEPITAKSIAIKYSVSLRTIRNDIHEIDLYLQEKKHVRFLKVPGLGMRIVSDHSLYEEIERENNLATLSIYQSKERETILLLCFLLIKNPITADQLASWTELSKNTVINEIKAVNRTLAEYHCSIVGRKNHGYYLKGDELDLLSMFNTMIETKNRRKIQALLFGEQEMFLSTHDKRQIDHLLDFINDDLVMMINDYTRLKLWLAFFIKRCLFGKELKLNHNYYVNVLGNENHQKIEKLAAEISYLYGLHLQPDQLQLLTFITANYTYWTDDKVIQEETDKLVQAVEAMLKEAQKVYPEIISEYEQLKQDVLTHIQLTLNRYQLHLPNTNPLLTQIKTKYADIFSVVKQSAQAFERIYHLKMDEDEIGFLTLYFCRSLEQSHQLAEAKILVVCNTGRGASKLLAARIMNNLPGVHIVGMIPVFDLERQSDLLDNVDLVLSTIPLRNVNKPVVYVSPFVSEQEMVKIKEVILEGKNKAHQIRNDPSEMINSLISRYVPTSKIGEFTAQLDNLINFSFITQEVPQLSAELYAETCVETCMMLAECTHLKKTIDYQRMSGILAHILMSLPRWLNGRFISAYDQEEMKAAYPELTADVLKFIHTMEERLNIYIDPIEAIAILRYLI